MKIKAGLCLLVAANLALADAVTNQQFVMAQQNNPAQLQAPFNSNSATTTATASATPTAYQNPPAAPQNNYQAPQYPNAQANSYNPQTPAQPTYAAPATQAYPAQTYPSQAYNQPQYAQTPQGTPQYQQPAPSQTQGWQTRPQTVAQNPSMQQGWQSSPAYQAPMPPPQNYQQPSYPNSYPPTTSYQAPTSTQAAPQTLSPQQQILAQNNIIQPQQSYPAMNNPQAMPSTVNNAGDATPLPTTFTSNANEEQTWYNSCLKAITSTTMTPYANAFCQCGWQRIIASGLNPQMFISQNPADIQKTNLILQGISQECMVEVMKKSS